jgi:hypothetical protein
MGSRMLSEGDIQIALFHYCHAKRHVYMTPNVYLYDWESDFISLTKAGTVWEYEIKTSRQDFKKDAGKVGRHQGLETGSRDPDEDERRSLSSGGYYWDWIRKKMDASGRIAVRRPNYFFYVVPEGLISIDEVPKYAGLIYVKQEKAINWPLCFPVKLPIERPAPRLHSDPIDITRENAIIESHYWKYWKLRLSRAGVGGI